MIKKLLISFAAAGRDPSRYSNPNLFDPNRADKRNLSFGAGAHFCMGAGLAKMEARIAVEEVLKRFSDLRDWSNTEIKWRDAPLFRGPEEYELAYTPRLA